MAYINVLRPGAQKLHPFTIVIVANPALETPWGSSSFVADPILSNRANFDYCADYINTVLFGGLLNQTEVALGSPSIMPHVRVVSIFDQNLPVSPSTSLIAEDNIKGSKLLVPLRSLIVQFLTKYNITADIVFAVSASTRNDRASAYYTSDNDNSKGMPFTLEGNNYFHREYCLIPGMVAIHHTAKSVTALHEFGHAISSYTNGDITDLYVDSPPAINCRNGRPIPTHFAQYNLAMHQSDLTRDSLGYPSNWTSYHCSLTNSEPSLMDNYWLAHSTPEACCFDTITKQFIYDRVHIKLNR